MECADARVREVDRAPGLAGASLRGAPESSRAHDEIARAGLRPVEAPHDAEYRRVALAPHARHDAFRRAAFDATKRAAAARPSDVR